MLKAVPMTIKAANRFVRRWHRHLPPVQGGLFAVAIAGPSGEVCGVAIVGRPQARLFDPTGMSAELTRLATDGTPNACSKLYGLCRRIVQIMGYARLTTLTLPEECGASLRAAGLIDRVLTDGRSWDRPSRRRQDKHPTCPKWRWTEELTETR